MLWIILLLLNQTHTSGDRCVTCHQYYNKPGVHQHLTDRSVHFKHKTHQFISCEQCHTVRKNGEIEPVKMAKCTKCHAIQGKNREYNCLRCHYESGGKIDQKRGRLFQPKSHQKSSFKRKHLVKDQQYCLNCHDQKKCISCHRGRTQKKGRFHPVDYQATHRYERDHSRCQGCHQNQKSCLGCHQQVGIKGGTTEYGRYRKKFKIHPDRWANKHGRDARRGLRQCTSCHREESCLKCHKTGTRPHGKKHTICKQKKLAGCKKCHLNPELQCR